MKRILDATDMTATGALARQAAETTEQQNTRAAPGVHSPTDAGTALSVQAQPGNGCAGAQLTVAPVLSGVASSGGKSGTAQAHGAVVRNPAWYWEQAQRGDASAQFELGRMCFQGIGVEKDLRQAFEWFRKAAQQGYAAAQFSLGVMYESGMGVEKDLRQAFEWFRKAAQQGDAVAQFNLGEMYGKGIGVEKDMRQAFEWTSKAAQQGHAPAQFNLGAMYGKGMGVEKDMRQAFEWTSKAAQQGHAPAQFSLGAMYKEGIGVEKDLRQAFEWFRKAAHQEYSVAQQHLSRLYQKGEGVEKDHEKAVEWLLRSAGWGKPGIEKLTFLPGEMDDVMVDSIAASLENNTTIKELSLQKNRIGNGGAARLASLVDRTTTLRHIKLQGNPIDQPGLLAIAQAMRSNTTVRQIDFDTSTRSERERAELYRIDAECIINRDIGELLHEQGSWKAEDWRKDFVLDALSLLERDLIRADIKLRGSLPEETKRRVLEMQLCLSAVQQ